MTQALSKPITFAEFLEWKPENGRYELHNGAIIEMQPTGEHELVRAFLISELNFECRRLKLPYSLPSQALVKPAGKNFGFLPDVLLINRDNLVNEPLWQKSSTVSIAASIPLVVEVVSTNWRDDYFLKVGEYEEIGIPEYWIVDYAALGGRRFIGNPKQPTISVYQLIENEYTVSQFRSSDLEEIRFAVRIESPTFPDLNLTAEQIFQAAEGKG